MIRQNHFRFAGLSECNRLLENGSPRALGTHGAFVRRRTF